MRSMTGFGVGEAQLGAARLLVEMRSLNHRFLETRVRLSDDIAEHTWFVEQLCRERLHRGRYDVSVRVEHTTAGAPSIHLDKARQIYRALLALRDELAPGSDVPLSALAAVPELFSTRNRYEIEAVRKALGAALSAAIAALTTMRETEGRRLAQEIAARLEAAREQRARILAAGAGAVASQRVRLKERLDKLLGGAAIAVEAGRLETELALLADRADITEELVRLDSHFTQLSLLLSSTDPVGRKLDFLLQEIAREANTVGSKCQDANLAHAVVELKAEIERMREQVQNVE